MLLETSFVLLEQEPQGNVSVRKEVFDFFSDIVTQGKIAKEDIPVTRGIFIS